MTSLAKLCEAIDGLGLPWANTAFRHGDEPEPPYIVLSPGWCQTAWADDRAWLRWSTYRVSLLARDRDYALERTVAAALDAAGISYEKTVSFIAEEDIVEMSLEVTVEED